MCYVRGMRIESGRAPWEPDARRRHTGGSLALLGSSALGLVRSRWRARRVPPARERRRVGDGPSLWTYRVLHLDDRARLDLPKDMWGAPWQRVYDAWRARTAAQWWAITDADLAIVRWGELEPPRVDDEEWAEAFARAHGITGT